MGRMIYYEFYKMFCKKVFWIFLILCFVINGLVVAYQMQEESTRGYSFLELAEKYKEYVGAEITRDQLDLEIQQTLRMPQGERYLTQEKAREYSMLSAIYEQVERLEGYETYLDNIKVQAEQMLSSDFFAKPGTFTYRNLEKTPQFYEKLKENNVPQHVKPDFDEGVFLVTENVFTDFLLLVASAMIFLQIFCGEQENGTLRMLQCMKQGRVKLLMAKTVTGMMFLAGTVFILYGTNVCMVAAGAGFGDPGRAIQSLEGYMESIWSISVGEYIILFFILRFFGMLSLGILFEGICNILQSTVLSAVTAVLFLGAEAVLYNELPVNSWAAFFRQMNTSAILDTSSFFARYLNVNLFSYPVSIQACVIIMISVAIITGTVASLLCFASNRSEGLFFQINQKIHSKCGKLSKKQAFFFSNRKKYGIRGLWFYEWYKIFVYGKGAVVLFIFILLQVFIWMNTTYFKDRQEYFYEIYSESLNGRPTEEKTIWLEEEKQFFEEIPFREDELIRELDEGEIDHNYFEFAMSELQYDNDRYPAFEKAYSQYQEIQSRIENGIPAEYIMSTPWELLFGEGTENKTASSFVEIFLVMMLILCSCGAIDTSGGMKSIIAVTPGGIKEVYFRKAVICAFIAVLTALACFLPEMLKILDVFDLGGMKSPVGSFWLLPYLPSEMTMGKMFAAIWILRLIVVLAGTEIMLVISEKVGNRIRFLLICAVLFLLPGVGAVLFL